MTRKSSKPAATATSATRKSPKGASSATTAAPMTGQMAKEEEFARLVALGYLQAEAYRQATGTSAKDETVHEQASRWARKLSARIEELRQAAKTQAKAEYVYEYEDAMREIDEARLIAKNKEDAKAMVAASALKSKLSGLETEPRKNNRRPYEELSDAELDEKIAQRLPEAGYTIQ